MILNMNEVKDRTSDKHTTDILKALSGASRRKIIALLKDGEHCVCHLEAHLGYRQAYLSQQLKVLREVGIITDRREGWNVYYRVVDPQVLKLLETIYQFSGQKMAAAPHAHACSCPKCNPTQKSAG